MTRKQWKCGQLSERIHSLSVNLAAETARMQSQYQSTFPTEYAVVAEETRHLHDFVSSALERNIFDSLSDKDFNKLILDASKRTTLLALNSGLLCSKLDVLKTMAVYAEEVRSLSMELSELCGYKPAASNWDIPAVEPRSSAIKERVYLFTGVSGKYIWSESTKYIVEVLRYCPEYINNGEFHIMNEWRKHNKPAKVIYLDENKKYTKEDSVLVIVRDFAKPDQTYAVPAEVPGCNALANSYIGISTKSPLDIPVRECWKAANNGFINFIDWEKLGN